MQQYPYLFSQGHLGKLKTRNRLVMAPMVRNYADIQGKVTDRYVAHLHRIAQGGVGTMILEASYISPVGRGFTCQLGIHEDNCIEGLRRLSEVAHREGALIGPQLFHAGRQTSRRLTGYQPVAPSPLPCPLMQELPQQLDEAEIEHVIEHFGQAAARAKQAGFDFVEIHGAHGYLINQFLSPFSNSRDDQYGGNLENRLRFPLAVVNRVRQEVGQTFPVIYRISAEEGVPGGLTLTESREAAIALEAAGVDALHVSTGNYASYVLGHMIPPMAMPEGVNVELAMALREEVNIPVITVGKCRYPKLGEQLVREGKCDFVALGRTLLADPDWPRKAGEGKEADINFCTACNQGCISRLFSQQDVWCTVNPETGREALFTEKPSSPQGKVVIVGGGPAGLSAALTAARFNMQVVLFEQSTELGGQLMAAAAAPHRGDWLNFRNYLVAQAEKRNVPVYLGKRAELEDIRKNSPDLVVLATGALPHMANIPITEGPLVTSALAVLNGQQKPYGRVVIAGSGCSGAQTAEYLAEQGYAVTLLEAEGELARDMPSDERFLMLKRLGTRKVAMKPHTRLIAIEAKGVHVQGPEGDEWLPADTILMCLGAQGERSMLRELATVGLKTVVVGDALEPRRVTEAIAEGALAIVGFINGEQNLTVKPAST